MVYGMVWHGIASRGMVCHGIVCRDMVWYGMVQYASLSMRIKDIAAKLNLINNKIPNLLLER